jgi:C-terminal peptidase prc
MTRRLLVSLVLIVTLSAAAIPVRSAAPAPQALAGPRVITGSYTTTNPLYPTLGADVGAILYDMTGAVVEDFDFESPPEAQTLGTLTGDIASGTYRIELPPAPGGILHDFDGDDSTPPAVQVFVAATYINFLGDIYVNHGESTFDSSTQLEPMTYHVIGGHVVVWSARDGEKFPGGFGDDGAAFTGDDPLLDLPAGWSVVSLDTDPFTVLRDDTVDVPIIESFGGLHDYSAMNYQDAWDTLFNRMRATYPFTDEKRLDWDLIYDEITPLVQQAGTDLDFHLGITRLGELIPDTHINYVSFPVMLNLLTGSVGITRLAVTDDGEIIVGEMAASSPALAAGIRPGDVLVTVDGDPALKVLGETPLLVLSASTAQTRQFLQVGTMLLGPVGSQVTLTWRSADGSEHRGTLTRVFDTSALLAVLGGDTVDDAAISARMLDSRIGYIRVGNFTSEVSRADTWFAEELQTLIDAGAQGIILDLRDNGGGLAQLAMAMVGRFFPEDQRLVDFYYADGAGGFAYRGGIDILASGPYYDGPVAVLVNEMTGSAGEVFAYALQKNGRGVVIGHTPTSGASGEVGDGLHNLPGGLIMQVPTGRGVDPLTHKTIIEGIGVIPNIRVPLTRDSLLSPQDEVLLTAEAALLGQTETTRG